MFSVDPFSMGVGGKQDGIDRGKQMQGYFRTFSYLLMTEFIKKK
jgi:hypothetical protein